ncbi:MAG: hypothetical protein ACOYM2_15845 [Rectinemataceae bacterium]
MKMRRRSCLLGLVLTALVLPTLAQGGASSTRGVALVIGNAAYIKVKALANPVNDATDIGAAILRISKIGQHMIAFRSLLTAMQCDHVSLYL